MVRDSIKVVHLTASPFYGGPERQMIGLACSLSAGFDTTFLCFTERGKAQPFIDELRKRGQNPLPLKTNYPHLIAAVREVVGKLRQLKAEVLLSHGYKADVVGAVAARVARIPHLPVARGWTAATKKVRVNEAIDAFVMRHAHRVICVSEGMAQVVRNAGIHPDKVAVIRNSIEMKRFGAIDEQAGKALRALIPDPVSHIVVSIGRLSPEKGFDKLIDAAAKVCAIREDVGFLLLGDGPLLADLQRRVRSYFLHRRFIFGGFRRDIDKLLPHASCLVQASYREGLPNVVLEAMAASIPVVATTAGGTPELVVHGETGFLIPPGDSEAISEGVLTVLADSVDRANMGRAARQRVEEHFTFASQAAAYEKLLREILPQPASPGIGEQIPAAVRA